MFQSWNPENILTYHFDDDGDDDNYDNNNDDDDEDKKKVGLVSALVWFSLPVRQTLQI